MTARRLALADALAILAFATVGQLSHYGAMSAAGYAHDALPLLGCWFAAGAALGLYARARPPAKAFALTWLIGVTGGVLIRAAILGRHLGGKELGFLITSLVFVLLFVLAGRVIARVSARGRTGFRRGAHPHGGARPRARHARLHGARSR